MITRAQAEALLTLAEALEECERLGMAFNIDEAGLYVLGTGLCENLGQPSGMSVRLAVNALIPKSDTWVVAHTMTMSCPAWSEDIVVIKPVQET